LFILRKILEMKEKKMSAKSFRKMVVLAVALIVVSAGYARAEKTELQEKLSKDVNIKLKNVTIAEALEKIGKKAGVYFTLSDEAVWKLPQGEATRLSVALDGSLAESMTEMLNAFFMRYVVGDEEITIYPRPELEHILGRPTAKQLELLKAIYTRAIKRYKSSGDLINDILGQEVLILPVDGYRNFARFLRDLRMRELEAPDGTKVVELTTSVTIAQILGSTTSNWYLSGMDFPNQIPEIRMASTIGFREAKLDQIVDISFTDKRAEAIIQRLANWAGMELFVYKEEPSWLCEEITVNMQNVKLRQALRNVVTAVDGKSNISVKGNRIEIQGPMHRKRERPAPPEKGKGDDYVGKISIPMDGGKYYIEFMLREKDLTQELKKLREEKMQAILGKAPPQPKTKAAPKTQ